MTEPCRRLCDEVKWNGIIGLSYAVPLSPVWIVLFGPIELHLAKIAASAVGTLYETADFTVGAFQGRERFVQIDERTFDPLVQSEGSTTLRAVMTPRFLWNLPDTAKRTHYGWRSAHHSGLR
jgi:hypothetical protein